MPCRCAEHFLAADLASVVLPAAAPGAVRYNRWLGRKFSQALLNAHDQAGRLRILKRIDVLPLIFASLPDAAFTLHDVFATLDRVVTRWAWTGTLTGAPFLGIAARGQRVEFDAINIWSVRDGMLHEHWDQFDRPRALIQLGVAGLPQPFVEVAGQPIRR